MINIAGIEYNSNYQSILEAGRMYLVQVELECRVANVRTSIGIAEYGVEYGSNSATDTLGYASNRLVSVIDFTKRTYDTEMYLNYYIHPFSNIGDSTINYLIKYRINVATTMLLNEDMSITDIATSTGFSSSNYFTIAFKKITGMTPKEYKKKNREN